MKKTFTKSVIAVTVGALTLSSCIGSFGLTNSVLSWNKRATDNKFVNELPQFGIRIVHKKVGSLTNILYLYR